LEVRNAYYKLPDLETERLKVRRLALDDADDMFAYASSEEVARYVLWTPHRSRDDSLAFLRMTIPEYDDPHIRRHKWGIVLKATGRLIGTIDIFKSPGDNAGEIGYAIGTEYWGHGYVTEAATAVVRLGFEHMALNRIEARCNPANTGSARVMEKVGMSYEGTIREQVFVKGRYVDLKVYSILKREYDAGKDKGSTG